MFAADAKTLVEADHAVRLRVKLAIGDGAAAFPRLLKRGFRAARGGVVGDEPDCCVGHLDPPFALFWRLMWSLCGGSRVEGKPGIRAKLRLHPRGG